MPAVAAALTARDLVPGRTARLQVGDSIETAIGVLTQKGVSSLPVLDGRRLVGILSEWDCLHLMALDPHTGLFETPLPQVDAVMTRDLRTVHADDELQALTEVFVNQRFHRVPVIDDKQHLVGMLGRGDVLSALRKARAARHRRTSYPDYRRPA